ncbi:hypothetical protein Tco_0608995 [Tanacetum coccineum]
MSKSANRVSPTPDGSVIRNTKGTRSKQTLDGRPRFKPEEVIQFCDKHYNQLLPLMAENVHHEKLKGEISKKIRKPNPSTKSRTSLPFQSPSVFFRLRHRDSKPSHHESMMGTNGSRDRPRREQRSDPKMRSERQRKIEKESDVADRANYSAPTPTRETPLSESEIVGEGTGSPSL